MIICIKYREGFAHILYFRSTEGDTRKHAFYGKYINQASNYSDSKHSLVDANNISNYMICFTLPELVEGVSVDWWNGYQCGGWTSANIESKTSECIITTKIIEGRLT